MKAVLMAAGVGSRISKSIDRPKCTLEVGGVPLILKTVRMLRSEGIDVAVVLGYEQDFIRGVLEDEDVSVYVNPFFRVTNSMASLWFAKDFIDFGDDLMLANADVYWDEDILQTILDDDHGIMMLADRSRVDEGDYFFYVEDGYLRKYGKELKREERTSEYVGMAKIPKEHLPLFMEHLDTMVKDEKYGLWWENVLYEYLDTEKIFVKDISELFWAEIDYIDDYKRILEYASSKDIAWKTKRVI